MDLSVCLSVYLSVCLSIYLFMNLPTYLPAYLPTYLPACLPACLPVYLPTHLFSLHTHTSCLYLSDSFSFYLPPSPNPSLPLTLCLIFLPPSIYPSIHPTTPPPFSLSLSLCLSLFMPRRIHAPQVPARYVDESECHLLVDRASFGQHERHYERDPQWEVLLDLPFLVLNPKP